MDNVKAKDFLKVELAIAEMDVFQEFLEVLGDVLMDEDIPYKAKDRYRYRIESIMGLVGEPNE